MRELLNANTIAVTIQMLRTSDRQRRFLLVEGDVDVRLLKRLVDPTACHVQICYNRANVIRVVAIVDGRQFIGHLGVIDRDFADMLNETFDTENIVMTDHNDIEMTIYQSDVFDRFISEYANAEKVRAVENAKQLPLREILVSSASTLGTLRYLSRSLGWNLDFEGMTVRFIDRDVQVDLPRQVEHLRGRSRRTTMPNLDDVMQLFNDARRRFADRCLHSCGHDICEIMSKGIHDVFGRAHVALSRGGLAVEEVFRAAFTAENFAATQLFADIRAWETTRVPFSILYQ